MARDYKHTKRRSAGSGISGVAGFVLGLALGLSVAMAVYLYDRRPSARMAQSSAPMTREETVAKESKPTPASQDPEFEFYDMLPKFEVVVPEQGGETPREASSGPVQKPGAYILQAGSFRSSADADRVRASIALQ